MSSILLSESINKAMNQLTILLKGLQGKWLVGGSCGLLLQNVQLSTEPRDLDVYTDQPHVDQIAELLQAYVITPPHYNETTIYRSNLSHYELYGVQIELVGDFSIISEESSYRVEVSEVMEHYSAVHMLGKTPLRLMPLAHEFVFNILRNRSDRYECIAAAMQIEIEQYIPALIEIIQRNRLSSTHLMRINQLLDTTFRAKGEVHHEC